MADFFPSDLGEMDGDEKADAFSDVLADVCAFADLAFGGTNARFAVVAWIDGHCDSVDGIGVGAHPESRGEVAQAMTFAADWAKRNLGEGIQ